MASPVLVNSVFKCESGRCVQHGPQDIVQPFALGRSLGKERDGKILHVVMEKLGGLYYLCEGRVICAGSLLQDGANCGIIAKEGDSLRA